MSAAPVQGVCPVVETPFTSDESVDLDSFEQLLCHLRRAGATAVMLPGFASEFYKLSDAERSLLVTAAARAADAGSGPAVIASIAEHATRLAVSRASELVSLGVAGLNLLPPYQQGPDAASVIEHIASVCRAAAPLPVVLQYAPVQTGTALDATTIKQLAAEHPNLAQVKVEAVPPGAVISALASQPQPLPAAVGYAGVQLIDALRRGAVGVMPGCSFTELYVEIWNSWEHGDRAQAERLHRRLLPYISYWMQSVELIVAAEKRISQLRGLISSEVCRAPRRQLDQEELSMIDRFLEEFANELSLPADETRQPGDRTD